MKLVKVTAWPVLDPEVEYRVETDEFFDGWLAGEPERAYEIVDGEKVLLNFHYEAYWKNGLLAAKGTWIDGLKQGFWQHYNENGTIACRGIKIDDRWVGRWQFYDENGQLKLITDREIDRSQSEDNL
jgi:antitoxin component YwqK of YwqJK toxin-antitoxin module